METARGGQGGPHLVGRAVETALLARLVATVRGGGGAALVVAGEAGIGKTALLEHAAGLAESAGLLVLRARGSESEMNLPFSGLADVLRPVTSRMGSLPERQRTALAGALALGPPVPAERFAVCAATLGLLAHVASESPVLVLVDDAHWVDPASLQALAFTARRLRHDGIGLVLGIRLQPRARGLAAGLARIDAITLSGLDPAAARKMLAGTVSPPAPDVAERLAVCCGGNPLAMLEVSAALSAAQRAGTVTLPEPVPVTDALHQAFGRRLAAAGPAARPLLLLAAADEAATLADLTRALASMAGPGHGFVDSAVIGAAQDAGLIQVTGGRAEFTHPLLRSAAYYGASAAQRRAAHRALADIIDPARDPVRRAWHLAAAAVAPDENVAASLDAAAAVALERNAFAAACQACQRAAELTADPARSGARWLTAGQAAYLGGDGATAIRLLTRAAELAADPAARGSAQVLRARVLLWRIPPRVLHGRLVSEAEALLPGAPGQAAELLAAAGFACVLGEDLALARELAQRAAALAGLGPNGRTGWLVTRVLLGTVMVLTGDHAAGHAILAAAAVELGTGRTGPDTSLLPFFCAAPLTWCEDYASAQAVLAPALTAARDLGSMANLGYGLAVDSHLRFRLGDWGRAYSSAAEAVEVGTSFGAYDLAFGHATLAQVEAGMGAERPCLKHVEQARAIATASGFRPARALAAASAGLLALGLGDYERAVRELDPVRSFAREYGLAAPCVLQWRADYIEALARLASRADAERQLAVLDAEAAATGSEWGRAAAARCRAVLAPAGEAVAAAERAVALAASLPSGFDRARARLVLGESLRRTRARAAARQVLTGTVAVFVELGARPWAERAAAEVAACGGSASLAAHRPPPQSVLTPQELRVALQVAEGLSNNEVAARLFVSPKTVEAHLSSAYAKLGVRSRTALALLVAGGLREPRI